MDGHSRQGRAGAGQGGDLSPMLAGRLDHLDATTGEILALVRGILTMMTAEADAGRPRLVDLLAEIVALQRETLRVAQDNAAALRRLTGASPPAGTGGLNGHDPAGRRRG